MPRAARVTDQHTCPEHGGAVVTTGDDSVIIGFHPAARVGDVVACPAPDAIREGSTTVLIGHRWAARLGDAGGEEAIVGFLVHPGSFGQDGPGILRDLREA